MTSIAGTQTHSSSATHSPLSGWIVSRRFDWLWFYASAAVVLLGWGAAALGVPGFYVLAAVGVLSNGPHLTSTWTRVYMDRREARERPWAYVVVPLLLTAGTITIVATWNRGGRFLTTAILLWATWHFASQCYGLLRIYQRKSGEAPRLAHRLESWFIFSVAMTGLLWRLHFGPRVLFGASVMLPELSFAWVALALGATQLTALGIVIDRTLRIRRGESLAWRRLGFLLTTVMAFWVPFMLIKHGTIAFASAACWHGFQYLGIMYHYNQRKFSHDPAPQEARLIAWLSQPGRAWLYGAFLLALAGLAYVTILSVSALSGWSAGLVATAVWTSLTLSHYWLDGLIWKMRKKQVATNLALTGP